MIPLGIATFAAVAVGSLGALCISEYVNTSGSEINTKKGAIPSQIERTIETPSPLLPLNEYEARVAQLESDVREIRTLVAAYTGPQKERQEPEMLPEQEPSLEQIIAENKRTEDMMVGLLLAERNLGVDPRIARSLYNSGMKYEDLERMAGNIEGLKHITDNLPLEPAAQAEILAATNTYQQGFMKKNGLSTQEFGNLPLDNGQLFAEKETAEWGIFQTWVAGAAPKYMTPQQQQGTLMYLASNKNHLDISIANKIKNAKEKAKKN